MRRRKLQRRCSSIWVLELGCALCCEKRKGMVIMSRLWGKEGHGSTIALPCNCTCGGKKQEVRSRGALTAMQSPLLLKLCLVFREGWAYEDRKGVVTVKWSAKLHGLWRGLRGEEKCMHSCNSLVQKSDMTAVSLISHSFYRNERVHQCVFFSHHTTETPELFWWGGGARLCVCSVIY